MRTEHRQQVRRALRGKAGKDLLPSPALLEAYFHSDALLAMLRHYFAASVPPVESANCKIAILAIGSLGRGEFDLETSDLDLVVLAHSTSKKPTPNELRSRLLSPLASHNAWLTLDDKEAVASGAWDTISSLELKYPIVYTEALEEATKAPFYRDWQILFEGKPLYNPSLCTTVLNSLLALKYRQGESGPTDASQTPIPLEQILKSIPAHLTSLENPKRLYKSAAKYWKARFLRDFYAFSNLLTLVRGWFLISADERFTLDDLCAPTIVKLLESLDFPRQLDKELRENPALASYHEEQLQNIMKEDEVDEGPLLLYGGQYTSKAARLLHGMIVNLYHRFGACRSKLYDQQIKVTLSDPALEEVNFDSRFTSALRGDLPEAVNELLELRASYLKYMSCAAKSIREVFGKGRVWAHRSVPQRVASAMDAFCR